ncbi:hypothetical protein AQUCO_00900980v1 [Aquilegia coerulea]|uniref:F-box associated beta-propeller type 3 domain-containing protein n=1 Tax=Aquilegia coerulea TaxID=218851 RepID=A0A2G5EG71_AQUCA|nr:hypothetical protein AQUCO_00900980v1 [Aquilegia coerulea]
MVPGFGFHEASKQYKVVQLFYWFEQNDIIKTDGRVFTLGCSKSWRRLDNVPNVHCCYKISSSASVNGSLHWFTGGEYIISFDLGSENFGFIAYPQFSILSENRARYHPKEFRVINLGGWLSISDASYVDHIELWIMKEYNVHESWTKYIVSRTYGINGMPFTKVLPISIWKNGEILLLYDSRILVLYDFKSDQYTPLQVDGIPECSAERGFGSKLRRNSYANFEVFPYVGNLMSLKSLCKIDE